MFLESSPSSLICAIYLQFATALTYVIEPSFRLWLPGGQWHYCHPAPKNFFSQVLCASSLMVHLVESLCSAPSTLWRTVHLVQTRSTLWGTKSPCRVLPPCGDTSPCGYISPRGVQSPLFRPSSPCWTQSPCGVFHLVEPRSTAVLSLNVLHYPCNTLSCTPLSFSPMISLEFCPILGLTSELSGPYF